MDNTKPATPRAVIQPAREYWAYPQAVENYRARNGAWVEVSERFYWQALEVLPPIYVNGGFMVSEPHTHEGARPVYSGFAEVGDRYFMHYCTRAQWDERRAQLLAALHGGGHAQA